MKKPLSIFLVVASLAGHLYFVITTPYSPSSGGSSSYRSFGGNSGGYGGFSGGHK